MTKKYIFITGGVVSSLGKGLTASAIGMLLESQGFKIAMMKLDPYLNVDPGTMNPFQHGEIYVTDDGAETDLDLGHYYRFTHSPLSKASNATSGQIYHAVIQQERHGDYLGNTVQVIPHVTDEIKRRIYLCSEQERGIDIVLVEIGGTVGDIESQPFLEAIRQFCSEHTGDCINIHMTYIPFLRAAKEIKTKPTQHSVQQLRGIGLFPDLIICRTEIPISVAVREKIALFCSLSKDAVLEQIDVKHSIYELPLIMIEQKLDTHLSSLLNLRGQKANIKKWTAMLNTYLHPHKKLTVGLVGKYIKHRDAYKSVVESLQHGAIAHQVELEVVGFESDKAGDFGECDGYLVPGGFGERGFEGKLAVAKMCREKKIPFFGICLGMQVLVIEFARSVLNLTGASSTEIDPNTPHPIISLLSEQRGIKTMGGSMRLGLYPCHVKSNTLAHRAYEKSVVEERHRHRFEFNNMYRKNIESGGLVISGTYKDLIEILEIKEHPWMVGVQFHPEFKSKPTDPHPLFKAFVGAMLHG